MEELSPRDKLEAAMEQPRLDGYAESLWKIEDLVCVYTDDAPPVYYWKETPISSDGEFVAEQLTALSFTFDYEPLPILPTHEELTRLIPECAVVIDLRNWQGDAQ